MDFQTTFFAALSLGVIFDFLLFAAQGVLSLSRAVVVVVVWVIIAAVIAYAVGHFEPWLAIATAIAAPGTGRLIGHGMGQSENKRRVYRAAKEYL